MTSSLPNKINTALKNLSIGSLLTLSALSATATTGPDSYAEAFNKDGRWPQYVTPNQKIVFEDGTSLSATIPVVFSRAYEDGTLAVVDRIGAVLIDYTKTDFTQQVSELVEKSGEEQNFDNFIRQLGRRVFDLSHSKTKAVSEKVLSEYDSFLICKSRMDSDVLDQLKADLTANEDWLKAHNCRPIIVFEESVRNAEFYKFLETNEINFPVVVPIFTKGFIDFTFTQREADAVHLWINKNGKLLAKGSSVEKTLR